MFLALTLVCAVGGIPTDEKSRTRFVLREANSKAKGPEGSK